MLLVCHRVLQLLKMIIISKQKQLSEIDLCSFVAKLSLVTRPKFYTDRVNSWLVIQNLATHVEFRHMVWLICCITQENAVKYGKVVYSLAKSDSNGM